MSLIRSFRVLVLLAALAAVSAAPAAAQSLLAARGLGFVAEPVDGRARGMGGIALGLPGYSLSLVNPAGVAGVPAPTLLVAFQPGFFSAEVGEAESDGSTARFPLIHAAFPVGARWTASVGFGSYLDQNWAVEEQDTLFLTGRTLPFTDRFESDGGVSRFRAGGAYTAGERLAVGAALDLFTGSVSHIQTRLFRTDTVSGDSIGGAFFRGEWTYGGVGGALGARWSPFPALELAAAVSAGGTLEADPEEGDSLIVGESYSIPVRLHGGASGRLTEQLLVALSGEWSGWSTLDDDLARVGGARDGWTVAGGVEWGETAVEGGSSYPLRVGARYSALPFRWGTEVEGAEFPSEKAVTAGLGARLAGGAALADLGVERGWRGGGDAILDESYWRLNISLTLLAR